MTRPAGSVMFSHGGRRGQAVPVGTGIDEEEITLNDRQNNGAAEPKTVKVTDRRMFTPDGELREEYRHLEDVPARQEPARPEPDRSEPGTPEAELSEPPPREPEPGEASFFDLVSLLGEHASIYLRQATVPDGEAAQNLEMARLHIDLLDVLKQKTAGNLDREEQALLDDVLYRLRLAVTSQRGL